MTLPRRVASIERSTAETSVKVTLDLDGGPSEIDTGIGFFDHMLTHLARHGGFGLQIHAQGDLRVDEHHTIEDVAIVLGQAFDRALGDKRGIRRMGHAIVPMDETLALVAVDWGGRGKSVIDVPFVSERIGAMPTQMIGHFLDTFAVEARFNLHARLIVAGNDHHRAEAVFKALARALSDSVTMDPRRGGTLPSTKEHIESRN
ncbi:MAG: imidazoleglycerol-phosphate dehydratase HisB [Dehalococcoidia bacterium]|nr:imidazoleglycerol-phosphate dehydratase HisB [Dehalococcoidia bacterium]